MYNIMDKERSGSADGKVFAASLAQITAQAAHSLSGSITASAWNVSINIDHYNFKRK